MKLILNFSQSKSLKLTINFITTWRASTSSSFDWSLFNTRNAWFWTFWPITPRTKCDITFSYLTRLFFNRSFATVWKTTLLTSYWNHHAYSWSARNRAVSFICREIFFFNVIQQGSSQYDSINWSAYSTTKEIRTLSILYDVGTYRCDWITPVSTNIFFNIINPKWTIGQKDQMIINFFFLIFFIESLVTKSGFRNIIKLNWMSIWAVFSPCYCWCWNKFFINLYSTIKNDIGSLLEKIIRRSFMSYIGILMYVL